MRVITTHNSESHLPPIPVLGDERSGSNGMVHNGDLGAGSGESGGASGGAGGGGVANSLNGVLSHASDITSQQLSNGTHAGAAAAVAAPPPHPAPPNGDSSSEQQQSSDGQNGGDANTSGTTVGHADFKGTNVEWPLGLIFCKTKCYNIVAFYFDLICLKTVCYYHEMTFFSLGIVRDIVPPIIRLLCQMEEKIYPKNS